MFGDGIKTELNHLYHNVAMPVPEEALLWSEMQFRVNWQTKLNSSL
jgi:hypothetical protein